MIDPNPTIGELAGVGAAPGIDGRSLAPVLRGETQSHRDDAVSVLNNFRVVWHDRYKLVDHINAGRELFDLEQDPEERKNLVEEMPDAARDLGNRLSRRLIEGDWHH